MTTESPIYIGDLANRLGRAEHTIRQWTKREDFPDALKPDTEGGRHKLFWVESQMPGLQAYGEERDAARGSFGRTTA